MHLFVTAANPDGDRCVDMVKSIWQADWDVIIPVVWFGPDFMY
jgi:hypothetical protein